MFCRCSLSVITFVVSIITYVYMTICDVKGSKNGIPGSRGQCFIGHPLDEVFISMMINMVFPRSSVKKALTHVEINNIEMATEWFFLGN